MVEVDGDLLVVELLDHARQLGLGGVVEDHHQAFGQLHALELAARHDLHVLRVGLAEAVFRLDGDAALVAGLEAVERLLEAGQQVAVADLEGRRTLVEGAVDHVARLELDGEVQGYLALGADTLFSHCGLRFCRI
ncbi:hypothetical protein D3C75_938930 [compost metagenome]